MTDYYVAFSIHRSHCFITANRTSDEGFTKNKIKLDGFTFERGHSRTESLRGATKLLWNRLTTTGKFDASPLKDAAQVHAAFMLLREAGWDVDDKDFVKKHGLKSKPEKKVEIEEKRTVEEKAPATPPVDPVAAKMSEASPAAETFGELYKGEPGASAYLRKEDKPVEVQDAPAGKPVFERLDGSVTAVQGDITTIPTDIMINAANADLIPGGGVDGAINRAAGPELAQAMAEIGGTVTGNAVMTSAYRLPAKMIAHAVGPIFADYPEEKAAELLKAAYMSAFTCAASVRDYKKVTAPLLSTGVYGYPLDKACAIAVQAARQFNAGDTHGLNILFVAFDDKAFAAITAALAAPSHE